MTTAAPNEVQTANDIMKRGGSPKASQGRQSKKVRLKMCFERFCETKAKVPKYGGKFESQVPVKGSSAGFSPEKAEKSTNE